MGAQAWWKSCRERSKSPENDTVVRLNVKYSDGSSCDIEGPFTRAEADELYELAIEIATKRRKAPGPLGGASSGQ